MKKPSAKQIFRFLCLTLSVALVLCSFTSCRKKDDDYSVYESIIELPTDTDSKSDNKGDTQSGNNSGSASGGSSASASTGNSGSVTTKGKTFTIVSDLLPAKESKDNQLFEKVFFERVREVEKQYGCTIKIINTLFPSPKNLAPMISAGKKIADVIEVELRNLPALSTGGYLKPWNEISGINTGDSKYTASYTKLATMGKNVWGLQFEKPPEVRYCLIMNKNLLKAAKINPDDIYSMINNKTWNRMINEDKVFMTASGMFKSGTYDASVPDYTDQFIKGKIAFLFEDSWVLNQQIRPKVKNFDYGMIMIPLGPNGTQYVSPAEHARVFTVTSTNKELDFTAKIFNELAKQPSGYTGDKWRKEEIQLDYFQKGDTKSMDIYLKSLESSTWDLGAGIDAVNKGFKNTVIFDSMFWKTKGLTPEAAIKSLAGTYDKTINDLFNK